MDDRIQVRLSGAGGQGLITAGVVLADAARRDGCRVVQTQIYGPSARLGASRSEVIISDGPIAYPEVTRLDVLLCMSQEAFEKYVAAATSDTLVVVDEKAVRPGEQTIEGPLFRFPFLERADAVGLRIAANLVALGAINGLVGLVSDLSLRAAALERVPERYVDANRRALEEGLEMGRREQELLRAGPSFG